MKFRLLSLLFLFPLFAQGQSTTYVNSVDSEVTIDAWSIYPLADNMKGIYAKPLTAQLRQLMDKDFAFKPKDPADGFQNSPEDFEEKPSLAQNFMKKSKVDAFLTGRISKGPSGVTIRLVLFQGDKGLPMAIESKSEIPSFDLDSLRNELGQVYQQIKAKVPYRGKIMSRRGQEVTLNVGSRNGLQPDQEVLAIQITKVERHPRFGFLVKVEKEIMGKIRLNKVEDTLSFGSIVSERTEGLLRAGFKVNYDDFVQYPGVGKTEDGKMVPGLTDRADADVAFGKGPKEWTPPNPPTFGKLGLLLGVGSYTVSNTLSASGSVSGQDGFAPSFHVEGEMWLSSNWFVGLEFHQYVAKVSNGLLNSRPSVVEVSTLETELMGGYNLLMTEQFWGPKLQFLGGITQMNSSVEGTSPMAYTSMKYSGMAFGIAGILPLGKETGMPLSLGGKFMYYWNPSLAESPATSGDSSSSNISNFSIFGEYQKSEILAYRAVLSFHQYNSNFSGSGSRPQPASAASHGMQTLAAGIVFLF